MIATSLSIHPFLMVAVFGLPLAVGIGLIATYGMMEMSGTPAFCGSCHVMDPYYESWKTSTHSGIACVDCHIPPGITAEIEKKWPGAAGPISKPVHHRNGLLGPHPATDPSSKDAGETSAKAMACHSA